MGSRLEQIMIMLVLGIFVSSCNTYSTFYSETFTDGSALLKEKVLRLDLSDSHLSATTIEWEQFSELRMLNLSGNRGINLFEIFDEIPNPEKLQVLALDSLNLKNLPKNIQRFKNLKQLSINANPDLNWSESFELISELPIAFLNLQHNNLSKLDANISEVKTIKDLNLSHNRLKGKSNFDLLSKLPRLYSLWLSHNEIDKLPKEIGDLKQLRNFYVPHNNLKKFPLEMARMEKVWVIHAEYNNFEELPEVLVEMPSLFSIHIGNCNIQMIPSIFETSNYGMKGLVMDNNRLTEADKLKWKRTFNNFFLLSIE